MKDVFIPCAFGVSLFLQILKDEGHFCDWRPLRDPESQRHNLDVPPNLTIAAMSIWERLMYVALSQDFRATFALGSGP